MVKETAPSVGKCMEYSVKNMNTCDRVERVNLLIVKQILLVSSITNV